MDTLIRGRVMKIACAMIVLLGGCTLDEVRSKNKVGPECRYGGDDRQHVTRWTAQTGVEFIWQDKQKRKYTTGVTYRRRDVNDQDASDDAYDNGVWFEFSFPLWKRPTTDRIAQLEQRVTELEQQLDEERIR